MNMTPEFNAAMNECLRLDRLLGIHHPQAIKAMQLAMMLAPEEMLEEFHEMAIELDVLPKANGYLEDGSPMYKLDDIAAKHGISTEKAERSMRDMLAMQEAAGLPNKIVTDSSLIHRKQ